MDIEWHYINLPHRKDRRKHAEEQFAKHGIKPWGFMAYTPEDCIGDSTKFANMQRTPGTIGCYQSQMELIKLAYQTDRVIAVCEDDIVFCEDLWKRLAYISKNLTWDWDIFYLGATFHVPGKWCHKKECSDWGALGKDVEPTSDPRILRTYAIWSTYGYLVNPINAKRTYEILDANAHRARGIDHLTMLLGNRLNTFCFVPGCAWQYDNQSDISKGVTRFSLFKKLGPYAWANRMEDFDPTTFDWKTGAIK